MRNDDRFKVWKTVEVDGAVFDLVRPSLRRLGLGLNAPYADSCTCGVSLGLELCPQKLCPLFIEFFKKDPNFRAAMPPAETGTGRMIYTGRNRSDGVWEWERFDTIHPAGTRPRDNRFVFVKPRTT